MVQKLKTYLPTFYADILPHEVLALPIQETKATCEACIEVPKYENNLKCCTFHPFLPNYLVGQILEDQKKTPTFISKTLQHKISNREYVLPLGVVAPVRYQVDFNANKSKGFGKNQDWLCPYYDLSQNRCGVWRNRGSVCTTFYCHSSKGAKGKKFWKEALDYLSYVEMALAEEALVYLDFSPRQISDLLDYINRYQGTKLELKSDSLELKKAKLLWNGYYEDQPGFFLKTSKIVKDFNRKQFSEAMGELGEKLTDRLIKAGHIWTI